MESSERSDESSWRSGFSEESRSVSSPSDNPQNYQNGLLRLWREGSPSFRSSTSSYGADDVDLSVHQSRSNNTTGESAIVPAEQERQILLLMLLAQVCALTDPTPRTFTVHVLELFERGILDRESIVFLFDLGLVPSALNGMKVPRLIEPGYSNIASVSDTAITAPNHQQVPMRVLEASAIRNLLEQQEHGSQQQTSPTHLASKLSWSAEHHPLHLSRFQREFTQMGLIASGSFGQVHRCLHNMDGKLYAVKCVPFFSQGFDNEKVQQVVEEIVCLAHCHSKHIVRYYTSWLEPSWMTGTSSSSPPSDDELDEPGGEQKYSLKLLTDVQRVVNQESPSDILKESRETDGSNLLSHRRRASFDASDNFPLDENGDDEDSLFDRSCQSSRDDLYLDTKWDASGNATGSRTARNQRSTKRPLQRSSSYRYQICMYIQMELCHSETLADWIHQVNKIRPPNRTKEAVAIFRQICQGLAHVHAKAVVHRDLKPANIFRDVDNPQLYKIGDFGLSKRLESLRQTSSSRNTSARPHFQLLHYAPAPPESTDLPKLQNPLTAGVGTASYAAPEQVSTTSYGKKADVFSVGLILLEMLCPFGTEHERIQTFQALRTQREMPPLFEEELELKRIILDCTNPDPDKRPSASALYESVLGTVRVTDIEESDNEKLQRLEERVRNQDEELSRYRRLLNVKDQRIEELEAKLARFNSSSRRTSAKIGVPTQFLNEHPSDDEASLVSSGSVLTNSSEEGL